MKRFLSISCGCFLFSLSLLALATDEVTLRDGSVLRGTVVSQEAGKAVVIRTSTGTDTIPWDDVKRVSLGDPASGSPTSSGVVDASSDGGAAHDVEKEKHRTAKNVIFLELGGAGLLYSVNYERFLADDFSARIGVGYISLKASYTGSSSSSSSSSTTTSKASLLTVPILGNYFLGGENHKLQLGLGVSLWSLSAGVDFGAAESKSSGSIFLVVPTAFVGYRYAPRTGGVNAQVGFTPFFVLGGENTAFVPFFGAGIGYGF